jgi:hypothetical protein
MFANEILPTTLAERPCVGAKDYYQVDPDKVYLTA